MRLGASTQNDFSRAYTLVEVLVVISIMGLAGAMVIPAIGSADVLRVQAAVRTVVSDLTFAQADAIAMQEQRAIVFDLPTNTYQIHSISGTTIMDVLYDPFSPGKRYSVDLNDKDFGGALLSNATFGITSPNTLIFDEFGAPVDSPGGVIPIGSGRVELTGPREIFRINVDGMTGQIWTERLPLP